MVDTQAIIDKILLHAETRYDPVKAHQYYERTKELKGRRLESGLKSDKQREGLQFVKSEVMKEKTAALDKARTDKTVAIAQLRTTAEQRREVIREKIRNIMKTLTNRAEGTRDKLSDSVQAQIDKLPPIPKGVSKEKAAELAADRRNKIAKIRGDARAERQKLSGDTKTARVKTRVSGAQSREQVKASLTASIEKARTNYITAKESIKAKYEGELDTEFNNIKNNVR
jgi:hypothetical protein